MPYSIETGNQVACLTKGLLYNREAPLLLITSSVPPVSTLNQIYPAEVEINSSPSVVWAEFNKLVRGGQPWLKLEAPVDVKEGQHCTVVLTSEKTKQTFTPVVRGPEVC